MMLEGVSRSFVRKGEGGGGGGGGYLHEVHGSTLVRVVINLFDLNGEVYQLR